MTERPLRILSVQAPVIGQDIRRSPDGLFSVIVVKQTPDGRQHFSTGAAPSLADAREVQQMLRERKIVYLK